MKPNLPLFQKLIFFGLVLIFVSAFFFGFLENKVRANHLGAIDCLEWSVSAVTGSGYSNIEASTPGGRILNMIVVFGGTIYIWSLVAAVVGFFVATD